MGEVHITDDTLLKRCRLVVLSLLLLVLPASSFGQRRSFTQQSRPNLKGARRGWRNSFLIEYYSDKVFPRIVQMGYKAVRNRRWKYIHYLELEGIDELYDLPTDPFEMKNLIGQPGARKPLAAMRRELERLLKVTR